MSEKKSIGHFINKIHCGKMENVLKEVPDNSIDCIVTDPPYGYSFMGKNWDKAVPPVEAWKECLRVLKSGGFMFVMSAPRQDVLSQMIVRLGMTGFEMGFTSLLWTYASGFPKSINVSLAIDKRECLRQLTKKLHRKPSKEEFEEEWKQFREIIGKTKRHDGRSFGSGVGDEQYGTYKGGIPDLTIPASEQAKQLEGSYGGFQPKPAVEIIIVCMKPLSEKTYVDQALKNGKGVTWLDDCRIPFISEQDKEDSKIGFKGSILPPEKGWNENKVDRTPYNPDKGRFPANLLVSDDVLNDGKITKGVGGIRKNKTPNMGRNKIYGESGVAEGIGYGDKGSFSRYFDLDKWWEKTVENLPEDVKKTFPFLICPKASKSERNKGCQELEEKQVNDGRNKLPDNAFQRGKTFRKNIHPTVKPIKLMSYLITLGSREGDIILDPYVGSGSTCIAAKILNRKWIGIDDNLEYCQIASARLNNCEIVKCGNFKTDEQNPYEQYIKDMQEQPQTLIETKKEVMHTKDMCPKCGTKMFNGKKGYYCPKANCDGRIEK